MKKKKNNLSQKVINFVKYHNGFVIGLMLVFVFSGAIFASDQLQDKIIGETIVTETGVDNKAILAADLENFDLAMTINGVFEDELNYYIDYSFKTLGILDNIWQELSRASRMTISKTAVGDKDLGLYISEELSEIADNELVFLRQVQTAEKEKGQTQIVQTTEYTGLIGLVLDIKNKILPGYEPVNQLAQVQEQLFGEFTPKEPESSEQVPWLEPQPEPKPVDEDFPIAIGEDEEIPSETENPEPICDTDHLDLCNTQELCEGISLFWYNDICNLKPEPVDEGFPVTTGEDEEIPSETENPEPICDAEHLDLCTSQELCEGVNLFWYNDVCNLEEQVVEEPPVEEPELPEIPETETTTPTEEGIE